jgi:hypothetical protein
MGAAPSNAWSDAYREQYRKQQAAMGYPNGRAPGEQIGPGQRDLGSGYGTRGGGKIIGQEASPPPAPDLTDELVQASAKRERQRQLLRFGISQAFLTGAGGTIANAGKGPAGY